MSFKENKSVASNNCWKVNLYIMTDAIDVAVHFSIEETEKTLAHRSFIMTNKDTM